MNVLSVTITAKGRALADRLPWEAVHGTLGATVRDRWKEVDGFVLFAATGVAVRTIAPLLDDKHTDPAVVAVDEQGRWAVALTGGHHGANQLARQVAALLGATAVVTTATDSAGLPGLDDLPGWRATGDVATVSRAMLDMQMVGLTNELGWPLFARGLPTPGDGHPSITVTDRVVPDRPGVAVLYPPSLVVGVGASTGCPPDELAALVHEALGDLSPLAVGTVATLDRKTAEPAIAELAAVLEAELVGFPSADLADVDVPNPSDVVRKAVGTPSVCEAAAILAGGDLVVTKHTSPHATVAVARRRGPTGRLSVVGLGPGDAGGRTPDATAALRRADVVIGYGPYIDQAADAISPAADVRRSPIGDEVGRATAALAEAAAGKQVALVCSGDAGVYALATLALEHAPAGVAVEVIPGVTAALAAAAVLGAPLAHDHVAISLSDLLTPWPVIERRLRAAADADLVVSIYNPRSAGRDWQLGAARDILLTGRPPTTPVGVVTDAGRPGQQVTITTLAGLDPAGVGMTTCVIVGSSATRLINGRMVTPRGYS